MRCFLGVSEKLDGLDASGSFTYIARIMFGFGPSG
jgi:hypothetical protein